MKFSQASFLLFFCLVAPQVHGLTLQQYLEAVEKQNRIFKSQTEALKASDAKKEAGDFILSPFLFVQASQTMDLKPPLNPLMGTKTTTTTYSLGLNKKFSTGLAANLTSTIYQTDIDGALYPITQPIFSSLGVSIAQSLWKDFFGHATDLRHDRENILKQIENANIEFQRQQFLITAESTFWDAWYLQEEIQVRQSSIERAERLRLWTSKRLSNGIGDKSDLLQVEALLANREFQLLNSQDEFIASRRKLFSYLEQDDLETPDFSLKTEMNQNRSLREMVIQVDGEFIFSFDAYIGMKQAQLKKIISQESDESVKPDLTLEAGYTTNAQGVDWSQTYSDSSRTDKPTETIALKFSMPLDGGLKNKVKDSTYYDFTSARLQAEKKMADSEIQWHELQRRYKESLKRVVLAEKLEKIQMEKLNHERRRLSQGRTITAQVITFEQEAADAQLNFLKSQTELKKLEIQARLFVKANREFL